MFLKKKSQIFLNLILIILCLAVVFPFILVLSISLSKEMDIAAYGYSFFPKHFDFSGYRFVFMNPSANLNAYCVTIVFSLATMILSVLLMSMIAYPLSSRRLRGRNGIALYLYFTMLFSGGLVPTYILITQYLHLADTIWVYILPSLISPWYVFMIRTFFSDIPQAITESAHLDGANEYIILYKIIMPVSKPVLAAVALFMFLSKWNDWYTSMLYINNERLISLQYLLQRIMLNIKLLQDSNINVSGMVKASDIPSESARMAMAVIVAGPALIVFPFFQKYFIKGLTVGSVKG